MKIDSSLFIFGLGVNFKRFFFGNFSFFEIIGVIFQVYF